MTASRLSFLGATGTVTGSKYLVEAGGVTTLVDCGLFQGVKLLRVRNWAPLPFPIGKLKAVVLTHAHVDHSGYLPRLVAQGFSGPVLSSRGTRDLCGILLPDSGHLQEEEARYANKRGFSKHRPALPLYTEADARASLEHFSAIDFGREHAIAEDIALTLSPAGHILGAASATLKVGGVSVVFSGDLGRSNDPILRPPSRVAAADYLVVESTYGNRLHSDADAEEELREHLSKALLRGGVVVMPAFAVGRAQTLLYYISRLKGRGLIPDVDVYLDSPMAIDATRLYHAHMDEHRLTREQCAAACSVAHMVNTTEESKALTRAKGPMIVISASGMATGGRVLHHLRAFAPDERNMILLPGFQAAGTRGGALAAGAKEIKIHGQYVPVRAEVVRMDNMSAHADYAEILTWLSGFERPPKQTFVTHGEPAAADELRRRIEETLGWNVSVPELGDQVNLR